MANISNAEKIMIGIPAEDDDEEEEEDEREKKKINIEVNIPAETEWEPVKIVEETTRNKN